MTLQAVLGLGGQIFEFKRIDVGIVNIDGAGSETIDAGNVVRADKTVATLDHLIGLCKLEDKGPKLMKKLLAAVAFLLLPAVCTYGQGASTKVSSAGSLPATCLQGGANTAADTVIVNNVYYICTAPNVWTAMQSLPQAGPFPYFNIAAYGGRAVSSLPTSTGNCNGTTTFTLTGGASGFQNGDGVVIPNCGPSETMNTPGAPSVVSGISETWTVPDAILVPIKGSSTYQYVLIGMDFNGGMTLPGTVTTITNGPTKLGMVTLTPTSASLSGNSLTITIPSSNPLLANTLVQFWNSSNALTSEFGTVNSVTGSGTGLTLNNMPITTTSPAAITSTGGNLVYAVGNQLTWKGQAGTFKYAVCAARPTDGSTLHFIGYAFPYDDPDYPSHYASSLTFTDWGATLTKGPIGPWELGGSPDSMCTAASVTNDYLVTTIVSGAGTSSLTLANAASQRKTGQTINQTNGPALKAASAAANTSRGTVVIPVTASANNVYHIYDPVDLFGYRQNLALQLDSNLAMHETLKPPTRFYGGNEVASTYQFQTASVPQISCYESWPCIFLPTGHMDWERFAVTNGNNSNQSLQILIDGGAGPEGQRLKDVSFSSGMGSNDFCGFGLVMRPGMFVVDVEAPSWASGPSNSPAFIGTTWCPEVYFARDPAAVNGTYGVVNWHLSNVNMSGRTFYQMNYAGTVQQNTIRNFYAQGPLTPLVGIANVMGDSGFRLTAEHFTTDTSPVATFAFHGIGGLNLSEGVSLTDIASPSAEAGGAAPLITGLPLHEGQMTLVPKLTNGRYVNIFPLVATTAIIGGAPLKAGLCASGVISVPEALTTMTVQVSPNTYPGDGYIFSGYVSHSGIVAVKVCAVEAGTPTASRYNVRVFQ